MPEKKALNDRSSHLMKLLVEKYIHDGQPVGSKSLQQSSGLNLSPATIRNIMSDLEHKGLLESPHTSAGRIPTNKGYRLFVDQLLSVKPIAEPLVLELEHSLSETNNNQLGSQSMVQSTSEFLSDMTNMASVVLTPTAKSIKLKHIEFLALSGNRLLVVMVTSDDEVQNRIIQTKEQYSTTQLHQMGNFLNEKFSGQSLKSLKQSLLKEMELAHKNMNNLMQQAINLAKNTFATEDTTNTEHLVTSGETNLMQYKDMADMENMRNLFQAFHEKNKMIEMLNHVHAAQGVQIYIGKESGYDPFSSCSLIAKSYQVDEDTIGVLGVIGPTRMSYNKIIPIVDITAKILTSTLNK